MEMEMEIFILLDLVVACLSCYTASKNKWLPSNNGQTFLQQVIPASLVYWPKEVSSKKMGMPQTNRKKTYGMKNAPVIVQIKVNSDTFLVI